MPTPLSLFQHTAARRRLADRLTTVARGVVFQHTAARRRLGFARFGLPIGKVFQHTAARRRLVPSSDITPWSSTVSTHSRPKAAGAVSQPPDRLRQVSTHSRPKAAGDEVFKIHRIRRVSTHSRPKAAGFSAEWAQSITVVSTHSRPKAAGRKFTAIISRSLGFNTQPPEGGWLQVRCCLLVVLQFQHTAARRRLGSCYPLMTTLISGFQHTAARRRLVAHAT